MTDKLTQKARVRNRLARYGVVSNLWAWKNGIWRLAGIIWLLRQEGLKIDTDYGNRTGRVTHYRLTDAK